MKHVFAAAVIVYGVLAIVLLFIGGLFLGSSIAIACALAASGGTYVYQSAVLGTCDDDTPVQNWLMSAVELAILIVWLIGAVALVLTMGETSYVPRF